MPSPARDDWNACAFPWKAVVVVAGRACLARLLISFTASPIEVPGLKLNETVTAGTATKLVITTQPPAGSGAGTNFTTAVSVEDASGNVVTSPAASVNLAIGTNPAGGTLGGTVTVAAVNGVATFAGLTLNIPSATGYKLQASSNGLTSAMVVPITVNPGTATQLVVTTGM